MIVLVTGSRDWPREQMHYLWAALNHELLISFKAGEVMELVQGAARRGIDAFAHDWFEHIRIGMYQDWVSERACPADWDSCNPQCPPQPHRKRRQNGTEYCPLAGHSRNQGMVDYVASRKRAGDQVVCLAFVKDESAGATHCRDAAKKAGIRTLTWTMGGGEVYSRQT